MALHGLAHMTLGVTDLDAADHFYTDFGLTPVGNHRFATADGGEQLALVQTPIRRLIEFACAADDSDDVARIRSAAVGAGITVTDDGDDIVLTEPIVGVGVRITVREHVTQTAPAPTPINGPGFGQRGSERAPAIFARDGAVPRRLGHVLYTSPDMEASRRFFQDIVGFRTSDLVPGMISFNRCSADHHNVGLINAPVPFFHHSSWQVDDVDSIGHGAQKLLAVDPGRNVWGLGRHFLGSNYFWYFRDPSGNYAEYFADLDQIDDAEWTMGTWNADKSLYSWGPTVPQDFVMPRDLDELAEAYAGGVPS